MTLFSVLALRRPSVALARTLHFPKCLSSSSSAPSTPGPTSPSSSMLDDLFPVSGRPTENPSTTDASSAAAVTSPRDASFRTFRSRVDERRAQAKRSVLVQVRGVESAADLHDYCAAEVGAVRAMFYHQNPDNDAFSNFFLVEFDDPASVASAFRRSRHRREQGDSEMVPVASGFLWFSNNGASSSSSSRRPGHDPAAAKLPIHLPLVSETTVQADEILPRAEEAGTLSEQMFAYQRLCAMGDLSSRLRFLACEQVEEALSGIFPQAEVLPFGSSVNSFGSGGSDLDMVVALDPDLANASSVGGARLVFHAKSGQGHRRGQVHLYCNHLASLLQFFLPGCQNVQHISHARVPIVKYSQQLLGLECDLSIGSLSGFFMSELLYLYGELDPRVRPLVYVVRRWAREHGLTEEARPTTFFTNFTLTSLVVFFLQHNAGVLPPYKRLVELAAPEDKCVCEDGVDCTFLRNIGGSQSQLNKLWETPDNPSVAVLLKNFFAFYGHLDFGANGLCLHSGELTPKMKRVQRTVSTYLDITNPLEPDLNVSANVQPHALERFQKQCRASLELLQRTLREESGGSRRARLSELLEGSGPHRLLRDLSHFNLFEEDKTKEGQSPAKEVQVSAFQKEKDRKDSIKKARVKVGRLFNKK